MVTALVMTAFNWVENELSPVKVAGLNAVVPIMPQKESGADLQKRSALGGFNPKITGGAS
jgi:hypothetical protein